MAAANLVAESEIIAVAAGLTSSGRDVWSVFLSALEHPAAIERAIRAPENIGRI